MTVAGQWGPPEAEALLSAALAQRAVTGVPTLLSEAATFVYRVDAVVAKVYAPTATIDRYEQAAIAGSGLAANDIPLVPPLDGGRMYRSSTGSVGFWPFVEAVAPARWAHLGALLRECHNAPALVLREITVPQWDPTVGTRWATSLYRARDNADLGLADTIDALGESLTARAAGLLAEPATLLHGDPQLQNVVVGVSGARLVDLDWLSVGPSVVDTAPVVSRHSKGAISDTEYAEFCAAYGRDPASSVGTDVLSDAGALREVVFRLALACRSGRRVEWLAKAVEALVS